MKLETSNYRSELCNNLFRANPVPMFLYDSRSLRILAANHSATLRYGYTLREFRAMSLAHLRPLGEGPALDRPATRESQAAPRSLWSHATKQGKTFPVELHAVPLLHSRSLLSAIDATPVYDLEEQFTHTNRLEAVGRLAGGIAHDFNNITQSISLSCELALHSPLPPAVQSKLYGILAQATRAAEITQQLLAFSRRQLLQPRVVNLNQCVRKAVPMLTRTLGGNVAIELHLDETIAPIVIDPDQLTLVLMHLANNARAAMPEGGILRISTAPAPPDPNPARPAPAGSNPAAACVVLTVSDTGAGMDEPTRQRIFEPFFSTRETTHTSGLGLSTVHGIILQSNGRIECESAPGLGTTFRIFLPIATWT